MQRTVFTLVAIILTVCLLQSQMEPASAATLLIEDFAADPVVAGNAVVEGDASRFTYAPGALTAAYDTALSTAKYRWPLPAHVNESTDFTAIIDFSIASAGFFADPNGFAQLAFGLVNSTTTGDDRAGGTTADAFDIVTFDYFPNVSPTFGGPSLAPTAILSDNGSGFFGRIKFLSGLEPGLDDEGPLPLDVSLIALIDYVAATRTITLSMSTAAGPLDINSVGEGFAVGGLDGNIATIQNVLDPGDVFDTDSFALTLWQDTFGGGSTTAAADLTFRFIHVEADVVVPEPTGLILTLSALMMVLAAPRFTRRPPPIS